MHTQGDDVSLNDYLTSYLKQFKSSFHSQLSLIQCISSDPANIQQKIQKAKQGIQALDQQNIPYEKINSKLNWKTLERFCLRINQYVQFRIGKAKGVVEQGTINELEAMCIALHRIFSQVSKDKFGDEGQNLQTLFIRISQIESKYMIKILRKMVQILTTAKISQNGPQLISEFVSAKLKRRFEQSNAKIDDQQSTNAYTSISNTSCSKRIESMQKIGYEQQFYSAKLRPKRSMVERTQYAPSAFVGGHYSSYIGSACEVKAGKSSSHLILRNPEEVDTQKCQIQEIVKLQTKMTKSVTHIQFRIIEDIVQIDYNPNHRYNEESLINQLMENNKKNYTIIQKYRKKARKMKNKMSDSPEKLQSITVDVGSEPRHKRSNTIEQIYSIKRNSKKEQKAIALPLLKRKSIKL